MNAVPRVLGFVAGCAALFAVALGIGRLVGPLEPATGRAGHGHLSEQDAAMSGAEVAGLEASAQGYTLVVADPQPGAGRVPVAFTIIGPGGRPVTAYEEQHQRNLHLVVVRRDLTGYQHVHPRLDPATGLWSTRADLVPGAWRLLADFWPTGGEPLVLGTDLMVPGAFAPEPLGEDRMTTAVDGYEVSLDGVLAVGQETVLTATVTRAGTAVTDLEPYLGAYGHLVSLRDGDLGFLHVHPDHDTGPGPAIAFHTVFPTAGRYRLFLDFRHAGSVHTAALTVTVADDEEEPS